MPRAREQRHRARDHDASVVARHGDHRQPPVFQLRDPPVGPLALELGHAGPHVVLRGREARGGGRGVGAGWVRGVHSIAWQPLTPPTLTPTHRAAEAVCARRRTGFCASENASIRPAAVRICALPAIGTAAQASSAPMPLNDSKEISGVLERRPPKWSPDSWTRKPTDAAMHTRPCLICQGGAQRTASALRTASASSTGYRAAAAPTSAVRIHSYWVLPYGHMSEMPIGSQALPPVSGPAPGSCLQTGGTRGSAPTRWQRVSTLMWQRAWRTRAPSACSPEPAPQARPGTAPGRTARRWWPGPATVSRSARRQLRVALSLLQRHGSASCGFSGRRPSSQVPSRAASAPGPTQRARKRPRLHV